MTEAMHRIIETNGIRMHIAEQGTGPTVVLCHGFPECWYSWRHQLAALAAFGFHAVAPDQRGYGQTDAPQEKLHRGAPQRQNENGPAEKEGRAARTGYYPLCAPLPPHQEGQQSPDAQRVEATRRQHLNGDFADAGDGQRSP